MSRKPFGFNTLVAAAVLVYWACGGDSTGPLVQEDPRPARAFAMSGDGQTGTVGQVLPVALVVQVKDQAGDVMRRVTVTFSVTKGGGTVSEGAVVTDANGQASVNWTLGTTAATAQEVTATVASATSVTATFTATATPDVAAVLVSDSGDGQNAYLGTRLPSDIVVLVQDQYGNGVSGQEVQFMATAGSGSLDLTVAFTDATGRARTGWTVGINGGQNTALALVQGLTGSPIVFTATAHSLNVESVGPNPLLLGQTGTISGTGFDVIPANNIVTIGGETVTVTAATPTQLEIAVPSRCIPAGAYDVQVTVGSFTAPSQSADIEPAAFLDMAVGEQVIIQDPSQFCLQFEATPGPEEYLIGVQSTSENVTTLTPITVTGAIAPDAVAAATAAMPAFASSTQPGTPMDMTRSSRLSRHRAAEAEIRELDRANYESLSNRPAGPQRLAMAPAVVDGTVSVGDTIPINVLADGATSCNQFDVITTVVRAKGTTSIWLEDIANPPGGYTQSDFQSLVSGFDNLVYTADVAQFGQPTDTDANGGVVMVITKEANSRGSFGFTNVCDVAPRSATNLASNEGEFFYGETPDPNGVFGIPFDASDALFFAPVIQAHELVHVIQIGRRFAAGGGFPAPWILEGQATLGEEIVGHADEGHSVGENLGAMVMFNDDDPTSTDWYGIVAVDLAHYFGWGFDGVTNTNASSHIGEAPHECSFLALPPLNPGPCVGGRDVHGTSWSLLRWLSDQFGPSYPGGEAAFHQDVIGSSTLTGFDLLASLVGAPMDSLLAQWAAMLYVDDRLGGANARLTMTSWDLADIFAAVPSAAQLMPGQVLFGSFVSSGQVRAASTHYTLISGSNRPGTAVQALDDTGQSLPANMQMWVVRVK
jgi:hypothetical protein